MAEKHTPGPWTWDDLTVDTRMTDGNHDVQSDTLRGRQGFALMASSDDETARILTSIADAALIAAAPDLLEACKAALRVLVDNRHTHDTAGLDRDCIDAYDTGLSSPISAVLSSAIAKAGGAA